MGCESCDKKKKAARKTQCDSPAAVIQINNPSEVVLFRKVVIPVSMGDETQVPPAVGKYCNVLLVYEANNHAYLYSSDGTPTLLTSDVAQELENRINILSEELQSEITTRQEIDNQLIEGLATETEDRISADETLQSGIDNEATARMNADDALSSAINSLSSSLSSEAAARQAADNNLSSRINNVNDAVETEATARQNADAALQDSIDAVDAIAQTALQPADIDKVVMTDLSINANPSTTTIQLDAAKENLLTGATSAKNLPLPVASSTQAGIMNSATFNAVVANTEDIEAILNGAVAINNLDPDVTQAQLTAAWKTETGLTDLINHASVYDIANDKVWTYYDNTDTWYAASNTAQVTIDTFTNSAAGTIKGSTNVGQVFAESDGTGSVNGWDNLSSNVNTNTSNITSLQTSVAGKQDTLTAGNNVSIVNNVISATDTTYSAGNGIEIDNNNVISADIYPADFFTDDNATVCNDGSFINFDNEIAGPMAEFEVKGNTEQQTYTGKNLWYYEDGTQTSTGITWVRDGNTITASGTATGTSSAGSPLITLDTPLPAGTYTMSIAEATPYRIEFVLQDTNGTDHFPNVPANARSLTVTTNYDTAKIRIGAGGWQAGDEVNFTIKNMQFEAGSEATDFEPYVGGMASPNPDYPQDIKTVTGDQVVAITGKNLFDNSQAVAVNVRATGETIQSGVRVTATQASQFCLVVYKLLEAKNYIGKTITLSANMLESSTNDGRAYIGLANANGNNRVAKVWLSKGDSSCSYTIEQDNERPYVVLGFYASNAVTAAIGDYVDYTDVQVEVGSTATDYEPYIGQNYSVSLGNIELYKVGDYQDYIYKSGDDWYVHKEISKKTLNGSETWSQTTSVYYTQVFKNELATMTPASGKNNCLSNYFSFNGNNTTALENELYFHSNKNLERRIQDRWPTLADWKSWLGTHNTDVYFPLATPTDTQITDATLIGQLEVINSASLPEGVVNVMVGTTGTGLAAIAGVCVYNKTLNGMIQQISDKQDKLVAGENITIEGNVISSTGGSDVEEINSQDWSALWQ